jgi:hypothetical protein
VVAQVMLMELAMAHIIKKRLQGVVVKIVKKNL